MPPSQSKDRAQKILQFVGDINVNGPEESLGAVGAPPSSVNPTIPVLEDNTASQASGCWEVLGDVAECCRLHVVTRSHTKLHGVTRSHTEPHEVTRSYHHRHSPLTHVSAEEAPRDLHLTRAGGLRQSGSGPPGAAGHRHHLARRPPEPPRHARTHNGHAQYCAGHARRPRRRVLARVLGWRHLRREHALPQGVPVGPPRPSPRGRARHSIPDVAARRERSRLHLVPGQRGLQVL